MNIKDIYETFDAVGCLSFTTVNEEGIPESRIAHLRAYDEEGMYFMTMYTKDFYTQLKKNAVVSICGMNASTQVTHDEKGMPVFEGGYSVRMSGKVKEVSIADIKAKQNPMFDVCIKDQQQYEAMVVFCIYEGYGDVFDYDFEKIQRDHKLERTYFAYNGAEKKYKGLHIDTNTCIKCGVCKKKCSFSAIEVKMNEYSICTNRCDECGDCFIHCPVKAIHYRGEYN